MSRTMPDTGIMVEGNGIIMGNNDSDVIHSNNWMYHWIRLRENIQESPIFHGKDHGLL